MFAFVRIELARPPPGAATLQPMTRDNPAGWAHRMATDLIVGGHRIPFDRVLARHLDELLALRAAGLTWLSLAHCLAAAGVRRPDGRSYSPDHLRVALTRLQRRATRASPTRAVAATRIADEPKPSRPHSRPEAKPLVPAPPSAALSSQSQDPAVNKDISPAELAAAQARLRHFKP